MSVISITITENEEQIISGIPRTVSITANIPSTIFYTLDGTTPTTFSNIYTSPILLPTDQLKIILKIYATNGMDSSPIISRDYFSVISDDARLSHASVVGIDNNSNNSLYPFGSNYPNPNAEYKNPANSGINTSDTNKPTITLGFDGEGNATGQINTPLNNYLFTYTVDGYSNRPIGAVGTIPAKTTIIGKNSPTEYTQEYSSKADLIFNPKAMVIFQDSTKETPSDPVNLNRGYFSMENLELRDGNLLYNGGPDNQPFTGSLLKSYYNPRTNMVTYYHYDSATNRWIISTTPYEQKNPDAGKLYNMAFSRPNGGNGVVFKWHLFQRRVLT